MWVIEEFTRIRKLTNNLTRNGIDSGLSNTILWGKMYNNFSLDCRCERKKDTSVVIGDYMDRNRVYIYFMDSKESPTKIRSNLTN